MASTTRASTSQEARANTPDEEMEVGPVPSDTKLNISPLNTIFIERAIRFNSRPRMDRVDVHIRGSDSAQMLRAHGMILANRSKFYQNQISEVADLEADNQLQVDMPHKMVLLTTKLLYGGNVSLENSDLAVFVRACATLELSFNVKFADDLAIGSSDAVDDDHNFVIPAKLIKTIDDMKIWEKSEAYFEYLGFILAINDAIKGKSNSQGSQNPSESVEKVTNLLDKLDKMVDEVPPIQQPQRFGNQAFRTWYQKLKEGSLVLLQEVLPEELYKAIPEIVIYLVDGFGNSTRIDYGTGHEVSFIMFLCCLFKIGFFRDSDKRATGCKIFPKYLDLVRKLQQTYRMEPAGSHGVWSLDDYQFVPFIWGSSQLFAHPQIEPSAFLKPEVLNKYGSDYMFLTCIQYINSVKTGPFAEHSNQLWSISGVSSWSKINGGLIKMYKVEVLSKFPVIQHIVFGTLFTLKPVEQGTGLMSAKTSMVPPPQPFSRDGSKMSLGDSNSKNSTTSKSQLSDD